MINKYKKDLSQCSSSSAHLLDNINTNIEMSMKNLNDFDCDNTFCNEDVRLNHLKPPSITYCRTQVKEVVDTLIKKINTIFKSATSRTSF